MTIDELRAAAFAFFASQPARHVPADEAALEVARSESFSQFDLRQMGRVAVLVSHFRDIRSRAPDEEVGLNDVLNRARGLATEENLDLVKWALRLFITHDPVGKRLPIPSLEAVAPQMLLPSQRPVAEVSELEGAGVGDPEAALDWYREDPWANQHHEHWHTVYPWNDASKDRDGELFLYMHQQMLARYDTERACVGLEKVSSLSDYRIEIVGGYDPGPLLRDQNNEKYGARPAGAYIGQIPGFEELEGWRDHLQQEVADGFFDSAEGADRLGAHAEASRASTWLRVVGGNFVGDSLHNSGHVYMAELSTPDRPGVIGFVQTAIRDPLFYRWHRHVDDISYARQQRQRKHHLAVDAPPVVIRKSPGAAVTLGASPDIMVALAKDVPGSTSSTFDGQAWAESFAGGARWSADLRNVQPATDTLYTRMDKTTIEYPGGQATVDYLRHEPFFYVFRFDNTSTRPAHLTARVFLVADAAKADRRMWIEMDKFSLDGPSAPGHHVVFRPGSLSSVIRQSSMPPEPIHSTGVDAGASSYCQCGWPYNLLLPRGTQNGLPFLLVLMLTDGTLDAADEHSCGSMSFCGMQDGKYPDKRPMGYPFDQDWTGGTIEEVLKMQPNISARSLTVRWVIPVVDADA
jgi:hypothetical protein